eukprot:TRINITY_DN4838_c0_g1_i4.p1 TRINITY_DN4838_c0_g1~~TRINITY_DN4838_c0_g1_i4.p1  ORF type:complete len:1312 (-),score=275.42 TRINITY_DN4838_c0_g1_i4:174-4109(-)
MVHLDDANILDNIKRRYQRDLIYTYTANVLLAVNPYKPVPHYYTQDKIQAYRGKKQGVLEPHPYAIADSAYRQMLRDRKNQALVISGESGAGKTETAKKTMHYLTSVSRTDVAHGGRIQDTIVNANPILESFGNASTIMNANSSRFGKYNEMMFDRVGSLVGAGIKTFLLESSRVVSQQPGEKNYHVFYELLAGMDDKMMERLMLDPTDQHYQLIHNGGGKPLEEGTQEFKRLANRFEELKQAFSTFVDKEAAENIWDVLGSLIHLGEVDFDETAAGAAESNAESAIIEEDPAQRSQAAKVEVSKESNYALATAAELLGLGKARLESSVLKMKPLHVKHPQGRTSHINCPRSKTQARQTLQTIIKILYKRLFDKIVAMINAKSNTRKVETQANSNSMLQHQSIGTLDIYGFERLEQNSFEQLCINLANERLQQFFVEEVLDAEQRMYAEESLQLPLVELPSSEHVVASIQNVMQRLDEHSLRAVKNLVRIGPNDNKDVKFCEQLHRDLIKDPRSDQGPILALKLKGTRSGTNLGLHDGFQIKHYAGQVSYCTRGWIDKNNDSLVPEIEELLASGTKVLVRDMADHKGIDTAGGERLQSVSQNYLGNLHHLLATLKQCSVHYIRCFNPNQDKQAGVFNTKYVLEQVIQCGTVELVKIMHDGYPHRCFLKDVRERFNSLLPAEFARYSDRDFIHAVLLAWGIQQDQWTLGTRRLFLKAGQLRVLEELRDQGSSASQDVIRKIRSQFAMKKFKRCCTAIIAANTLLSNWRQQRVSRTIEKVIQAVHCRLRISRWLKRARATLYGIKESQKTAELDLQHALDRVGVSWKIASHTQPSDPKIFTTVNCMAIPENRKMTEEDPGADYEESVLHFNGSTLFSHTLKVDSQTSQYVLDDPRKVDLDETGFAFTPRQTGERLVAPEETTVCMCQHPFKTEVFAKCNNKNQIMLFKWRGTRPGDEKSPAIKPMIQVQASRQNQILQMCFMDPRVAPKFIQDAHRDVLLVLAHVPKRPWLNLYFYIVGQGEFTEAGIQVIHLGSTQADKENLGKYGVHISHFGMSNMGKGRTLIIAGRSILTIRKICLDDQGKLGGFPAYSATDPIDPTGRIVETDYAPELGAEMKQTFMSALMKGGGEVVCVHSAECPSVVESMRRQGASDDTLYECFLCGMVNGEIFAFHWSDSGFCRHPAVVFSGRLRRNPHPAGLPVCSLLPRYKAPANASRKANLPSSLYTGNVPVDNKSFLSICESQGLSYWSWKHINGFEASQGLIYAGSNHDQKAKSQNGEFALPFVAAGSELFPRVVIMSEDESRVRIAHVDC